MAEKDDGLEQSFVNIRNQTQSINVDMITSGLQTRQPSPDLDSEQEEILAQAD